MSDLEWRIWKTDINDPNGYEMGASFGLEPFAVDNGIIFWRKQMKPTRASDGQEQPPSQPPKEQKSSS